ncbi:MAG: flagellar filament capping protein FliD [Firmicutes bacterium]|nr:flagellar filament capping protein FliD [Bacillota bacterium]
MANIQIMGLSSGMDYNTIIEQLLALERIPITRMAQRKNIYKAQQDAWRDINTRLSALDNRLTDLRLSATFHGRTATSSKTDLVTASAGPGALTGTYTVEVSQLAQAHRVASTSEVAVDGDGFVLNLGEGEKETITIKVGDGEEAELSFEGKVTLADIVKAINEADAKVKATIIAGRLVLESAETGENNKIELTGSSDFLVEKLKLGTLDGEGNVVLHTIQDAQDAVFTINGIAVTSASNTVKDAVEGVTFNLKGVSQPGEAVQITIGHDIDSAVSKIKAFVDQYNSVMSFIAEKTKVTMTDGGDISSTGTLQGDGTANRLRSALRYEVTRAIETDSSFNQLAVLGITTNKEGILEINETKLREVLRENPEQVEAFFREKATNLKDFIKGYIQYGTGILAEKQESIGRLMKDIDRQIERLEERIARKEESLVRQFTALEQVLSEFQSQSAWLTQQMTLLSSWAGGRSNRN